MIVVKVRDRDIKAAPMGPVTTGSEGLPVRWYFDEAWDELTKIAVFRVNDTYGPDMAILEDVCIVPNQLLVQDNAGENLWIGVYGRDLNGEIAVPTIWTYIRIEDGAVPQTVDPAEPTPEWPQQVQNAADEALRVAHGVRQDADDGKFDGYSPVVTLSEIPHGHRVNITDKEHQEEGQSFDVMDGASAYEQAVAGGYTGTEAEFAEDLAGFSEKAQTAASAAAAAAQSAQNAADSASTATTKAGEAADSAGLAESAKSTAQEAAQSALNESWNATQQASYARAACTAAEMAQHLSQEAQGKAEDAQSAAEDARDAAAASATAAAGSATAAADSAAAAASSATAAGNAQTAAEDAQEAAETAQAAAESARDTAITTLQTEGAAQRTAIQQKGAETLASIPEDYTDLSGDVDDLKSAVDQKAPAIYDTASGAIASFPDGADGLPLKKLEVQIVPVQVGSGDPSPSNVRPISGWTSCNGERTGKNRLSKDGIYQGSIGTDGTANPSDTTRCFSMFIKIAPGSSYTFSCESGIVIRAVHTYKRKKQTGDSWNGRILNTSNIVTFTAGSSDNYCRAMYCKTNYSARITPSEITSPQMENGSTATAFEEYSGEAISVQFPSEAGTVYGGALTINDDGTGKLKSRPYYASYDGETLVGPWISDRDVYAAGTTPTAGAQVVDMGGTETAYNITAEQITTLLGTNNICVYCGDIEVEYRADTKLYIQKINAPADDDMIADAQITSGKYFIVAGNLYLSTTTIPAGDAIIPGTNCQQTNLAEALNALNS